MIDDDHDILLLVQILLNRHGFLVEQTLYGSEVFKKIKEFDPGLILLDVTLIDGNGIKL